MFACRFDIRSITLLAAYDELDLECLRSSWSFVVLAATRLTASFVWTSGAAGLLFSKIILVFVLLLDPSAFLLFAVLGFCARPCEEEPLFTASRFLFVLVLMFK